VVEHDLAKVGVAGSNPVSRSSNLFGPLLMLFFFAGCSSCCVWPDFMVPEFTPKDAGKNVECKNVSVATSRTGERAPVLRRECNETPTPRD
jgi:hypothetical protein